MAGLALVAALATSCAPSSSTEPVPAGSPATTAGDAAATGAPEPLVAPLLDGGSFDLAAELAAAPVAMWFWAPG